MSSVAEVSQTSTSFSIFLYLLLFEVVNTSVFTAL